MITWASTNFYCWRYLRATCCLRLLANWLAYFPSRSQIKPFNCRSCAYRLVHRHVDLHTQRQTTTHAAAKRLLSTLMVIFCPPNPKQTRRSSIEVDTRQLPPNILLLWRYHGQVNTGVRWLFVFAQLCWESHAPKVTDYLLGLILLILCYSIF